MSNLKNAPLYAYRGVNVLGHTASAVFAIIGVYFYLAGESSVDDMNPIVIAMLGFSFLFWPVLEIAKHYIFKATLNGSIISGIGGLLFIILSIAATGLGISYYNTSISETSDTISFINVDSIAYRYDSLTSDIDSQIFLLGSGGEDYEAYGYYRSDRTWALNRTGRDEKDRLSDIRKELIDNKQTALLNARKENKDRLKENDTITSNNSISSWFISILLECFTFFMIVLITQITKLESSSNTDTINTEELVNTLYQKLNQSSINTEYQEKVQNLELIISQAFEKLDTINDNFSKLNKSENLEESVLVSAELSEPGADFQVVGFVGVDSQKPTNIVETSIEEYISPVFSAEHEKPIEELYPRTESEVKKRKLAEIKNTQKAEKQVEKLENPSRKAYEKHISAKQEENITQLITKSNELLQNSGKSDDYYDVPVLSGPNPIASEAPTISSNNSERLPKILQESVKEASKVEKPDDFGVKPFNSVKKKEIPKPIKKTVKNNIDKKTKKKKLVFDTLVSLPEIEPKEQILIDTRNGVSNL